MISLKPMNNEEYLCYVEKMIPSYASDIGKSKNLSQSDAKAFAEKQITEMLPQGLNSPDNYFYIITEEDHSANLGYLWLLFINKDNIKTLFIADIVVDENCRGKKIGTKTLELVDGKAKELNCSSVGLHVFGHNTGARKLYEAVGFEMTNVYMRKMTR